MVFDPGEHLCELEESSGFLLDIKFGFLPVAKFFVVDLPSLYNWSSYGNLSGVVAISHTKD
jgi:hypothetical protein